MVWYQIEVPCAGKERELKIKALISGRLFLFTESFIITVFRTGRKVEKF